MDTKNDDIRRILSCAHYLSGQTTIDIPLQDERGTVRVLHKVSIKGAVPCIRFISSSALNRRISASTCRDISWMRVRYPKKKLVKSVNTGDSSWKWGSGKWLVLPNSVLRLE